ncbi:BRCA1-A complex subunit BRE [Prunus yedoensis var. nudiflora]|uniref:BRISC and BRCA1-A complex member 2 n=1 Tax=Prunus yedoensis var. nudiflora TaxID=2094558 RepID=A0A315B5E9_PRUYE|nr:BRCA1-A complex subunit BRE [Prunus yedoensis var. nudiflora]
MSPETAPPLIAAQLNYLLSHFPLVVKIENKWSGSKYYPGILDRFTLVISYCLDVIKWDIIFDAESPMAAPDVIFGPDDENFQQFLVLRGEEEGDTKSPKKILNDWNSRDPTQLMLLIQELRDQYMSFQKKRVAEVDDDRLKFEISTIVAREGIEMHMSSGVDKRSQRRSNFQCLYWDTNINKMVPGCPWKHKQKIYLQVIYPVEKKYVSTPSAPRLKLVSTTELKSIFSIDDVKLPTWLNGMCMAEYLPHLEESLENQFGRPLEADPVFCRKATFLAASGVFTFLVHVLISTQFPKQQPELMLQSSQHFNSQGAPIKSLFLTESPWSPRWEIPLMAERICDYLTDEALNFKRYCNEPQLQH